MYQFHANMLCDFASIGGDGEQVQARFYKNGADTNMPYVIHGLESGIGNMNLNYVSKQITQVMNLGVGDYIEVYVNIADANGGDARVRHTGTNFFRDINLFKKGKTNGTTKYKNKKVFKG